MKIKHTENMPNNPASPLFSMLPRELWYVIWTDATAPYEDPDHLFVTNEYYYRPCHTARLKTDTNLLRTCRWIWLEANTMPMLQAEHSFYYHRAAPDGRNLQRMAKLTGHNRQNFGHCIYLPKCISSATQRPGRQPPKLLSPDPPPCLEISNRACCILRCATRIGGTGRMKHH